MLNSTTVARLLSSESHVLSVTVADMKKKSWSPGLSQFEHRDPSVDLPTSAKSCQHKLRHIILDNFYLAIIPVMK
jgi:hypothetical protein